MVVGWSGEETKSQRPTMDVADVGRQHVVSAGEDGRPTSEDSGTTSS